MAQGKVGSLYFTLGVNASDFEKKLNTATAKIAEFGEKAKRIGQSMSLFITTPILAAGTAAVKMASDYDESLNKVDVAFKDASGSVQAFGDTSLKTFGIAKGTALDMAALFGDMATSMGMGTQEAANLSTSLVGLAGDLASFKNMNIKEVTTALNGVFTGETESLKRLGVVMTEVNLEQFAMNQGITKTIQEMTQAEKVLLRYQYVMSVTANAHGDFERTGGGAANQMRVFTEGLKELAVQFGQVILPAFTRAIKAVNGWMDSLMAMNEGQRRVIITIGAVVAAIGPLLIAFGTLGAMIPTLTAGLVTMSGILAANPFILAATAAITLVAALNSMADSARESHPLYKKTNELLALSKKSVDDLKEAQDKLNGAIKQGNDLSPEQIQALKEETALRVKAAQATIEQLQAQRQLLLNQIQLQKSAMMNSKTGGMSQAQEVARLAAEEEKLRKEINATNLEIVRSYEKLYDLENGLNSASGAADTFDPAGKTVGEIEMRIDALSTALKGMVPHSKEFNAAMAEISRLKLIIDTKEATSGLTEAEKAAKKMQETMGGLFESVNKNDIFTKLADDIKGKFISAVEAGIHPLQRIDDILTSIAVKTTNPLEGMKDAVLSQLGPVQYGVDSLFESMNKNAEASQAITDAVSQAFQTMSQNLLGSLLNSENGFKRFVGGLAQTALKLISMMLAQSLANGIFAGTNAGVATGPAAPLTTPAFIATLTSGILGAFAAIPKFATGGAVTGPTLALVGENPASRGEAIIPFERMGSFLQQFGMGGSGDQHITISGQLAGDTIRLSGQSATNKIASVRWGRGGGPTAGGRALVN